MMNQSAPQTFEPDSVSQRLKETQPDRCSEIRRLLLDIMAQGPWPLEQRVDALSFLRELSDGEREVVQQIYQLCYETAEREADEKKMWRYQRLLRGLVFQKTAVPAGAHHRPDPLFSLEPQMEFAQETENEVTPQSGPQAARPAARAAQRRVPIYDAVYPACLFAGAVFVFVLTFTSGTVTPFNVSSTLPSGSRSDENAAVSPRPGSNPLEPTELQLAEAAAANEGEKELRVREAAASATNIGNTNDTPKPAVVLPQAAVPAATVSPKTVPVATAKAPMPRPSVPPKPTPDSTQPTSEGEQMTAPVRRSLGPILAVPELEAQLEALRAPSVVEARE